MEDIDTLLVIDEQVVFLIRCRPWRAKRRPVVPGRRRRGRLAGVAEGRSPEAAEARCKRIRYAVKPFDGGPWRSPTAPLGARRDVAVARSGANRGTRVVAERKAKGGLCGLARPRVLAGESPAWVIVSREPGTEPCGAAGNSRVDA